AKTRSYTASRCRMRLPEAAAVTDLVWLQTAFIGDLVLTTAAIELARRRFPAARQHLITTPAGAKGLARHPAIASFTVFDKAQNVRLLASLGAVKRSVESALSDRRGAVLLAAHRSQRSSLLARWLRLPAVAYEEAAWNGYAQALVPRVAVFHEA